jgi:hypothetical protein
MSESEPGERGIGFPLECQVCHQTFTATVSDEMAEKLRRAGVSGEEIGEAINRGMLDWRITCPACARGLQN